MATTAARPGQNDDTFRSSVRRSSPTGSLQTFPFHVPVDDATVVVPRRRSIGGIALAGDRASVAVTDNRSWPPQEAAMAQETLEKRVDMLERRVEILEQLPERVTAVESQIVQLRDEMRSEFSATRQNVREEIRAGDEETRRTLREEIRAGDEETRRTLRGEIRAGDEETRREMRELFAASERHSRVLHEDVIARIAAMSNGR